MAHLTKKAIMFAFEEMLREMPFDRVTVSALVKRSEVSPNTFYYHYQDIYDLLQKWLEYKFNSEDLKDEKEWNTHLKKILIYSKENYTIINHLFYSLSCEQLVKVVFNSTDDGFNRYVRSKAVEKNVSEEEILRTAEFLRYSFIGFYFKFVWSRMRIDIDEAVDEFHETVENLVYF